MGNFPSLQKRLNRLVGEVPVSPEEIKKIMNKVNESQFLKICSDAMLPHLSKNTVIEVIDRARIDHFSTGDIIAFKTPVSTHTLVRRITASPGESLISTKKKDIISVPTKTYWVECDNEEEIKDSRSFGFVAEEDIQGRAIAIVDDQFNYSHIIQNSPLLEDWNKINFDKDAIKAMTGLVNRIHSFFQFKKKE